MKVIIEMDGRRSSVEQPDVVRLGQVLELFEDVLRGVGFSFHPGTLRVDVSAPELPEGLRVVEAEVM